MKKAEKLNEKPEINCLLNVNSDIIFLLLAH